MTMNYEAEYDNRSRVPEHPEIFARWQREGAAYRAAAHNPKLGIGYGPSSRRTIDLFPAKDDDKAPLAMFIHGGYWRSLDPSMFSQMAAGPNARGITVAVVGYDLCPNCSIADIVEQMRAACLTLWRKRRQRICVYGHSAGGHLAAMMMCAQWPHFDPRLPKDLWKGALAISGVYDLRPLIEVDFLQPDLRLDEALATRLSPALMIPATRCPVMTCVGGDESSEFHRQNAMLGERWRTAFAGDIPMPGTHHFSVVDGLAEQKSALFAGARRLMKLDK